MTARRLRKSGGQRAVFGRIHPTPLCAPIAMTPPPSFTDRSQHVQTLVAAAIAAARPEQAIAQHVQRVGERLVLPTWVYPLGRGRVYLISVGKSAAAMARAMAEQLGEVITAGIVLGKENSAEIPPPLVYFQGGHPIPTPASVTATQAISRLVAAAGPDDLVLCLISGGASALLTVPVIPLPAWQALNQALLASGCPIEGVNCVRQHLDPIKGGGLATLAAPALCVSLIMSDVIGNRLEYIGSGPTTPTPRHNAQARALLDRYAVWSRLDTTTADLVREHLARPDTPLKLDAARLHNHIIGDVSLATTAAQAAARRLGFATEVLTTHLEGEAREVGRMAAALAMDAGPYRCLILGGETTVTLRGNGLGGRNQELALAAAIALEGWPQRVVASFATDAEDGPTPVAGAWVSGATLDEAAGRGLAARAYLDHNDSYHFFTELGQGHISAERGANVNDLLLILTYAHEAARP